MIYGIVPVGGTGSRLNLPFPKELLPLKGHDFYFPVCHHTVNNLVEAGCEKIVFVHGIDYKKEIVSLYSGDDHIHVLNPGRRQSEIFTSFYDSIKKSESDIYLYGLPDSWYTGNLFLEMKNRPGTVCGMFEAEDNMKVDRLNQENKFVKSVKTPGLSSQCWGVLKFGSLEMKEFSQVIRETDFEVADSLNRLSLDFVFGKKYFDLGTWDSLNKYWSL